jgi:hypothetical protein
MSAPSGTWAKSRLEEESVASAPPAAASAVDVFKKPRLDKAGKEKPRENPLFGAMIRASMVGL